VSPRVRAVVRKELREYRRNRFVVGTMVALPVFFIVIPTMSVLGVTPTTSFEGAKAAVGGALLTFFFVPLILPATLSAYAVIGERDQQTLEPVLSTPVTREELLLGKALAALIPTTLVSYALFGAFLLIVRAAAAPVAVHLVWQAGQIAVAVVFGPLLATFAIWVGIAMSTRSSDVRVAQQLSALATLPMLGLIALLSFQVVRPSLALVVGGATVLALIDLAGWRLVSAMFDRERLLARYGRG